MSNVEELEREITKLREEIVLLRQQRDDFERLWTQLRDRLHGKKTERFSNQPFLPGFGPEEEDVDAIPPHADEAPDDEADEVVETKKPKRKPRQATKVGSGIPRVEEVIEVADEERACPCCGEPREIIGYEDTEKLEFRPASYFVRVLRRPKLACKKHEEVGVWTPDLPPQVIDKGLAGASLLAQVITAKYRDHLPLYRQARIALRHGVELAESTLGDWIRQSAWLLQPIVDAMHKRILRGNYIATDDTSITVLGAGGKKQSKRAFLWAYLGDTGDVVFDFTMGRSRDGPKRMLDGYRGYLQADAYGGYNQLYEDGHIREVGCMAHARRRFFDALKTDRTRAEMVLAAMHELYSIEREIKARPNEERHAMRQARSAPLFDDLLKLIRALGDRVLPKSPTGKAVTYFVKNHIALRRYLDDPSLRIDNNRTERAMRQVAVGRKNWLFAGSEAGGHRAATLYSLTVGCWELGIDPFAYLTDVLERLATTPSAEIERLTPRDWKSAQQ
ncbi:MAG: IS66 family transposase [Planctomycetes bacterium]|nr:IS66 family transposase [Planctomycetota bacterium]